MNKAILIISLILITFTKVDAQVSFGPNLVNNPSFEDYYSCPINTGEMYKSKYWWGHSTDYYNACAIPGGVNVPSNWAGFQYANNGNAYAGLFLFGKAISSPDDREAIKTKFKDTLISNKRYCTNFFINLSIATFYPEHGNYCLLDSVGLLFSKDLVNDDYSPIFSNGIKVQNSISNIDTINWLKISNNFIANGGEKYLIIGNFDSVINFPSGKFGYTCVFIDDVSVCECSFEFSLGRDTTLCDGETLLLNPNMPNAIYTWQDSSHAATYKVMKAGTYWVRAYFPDYSITTSSSINVTYDGECFKIPNVFTPNNDNKNDYFVITNIEGWNIDLQVFNRWGIKVFQDNNYKNNWDGKSKGNPLADGVYYYIVKAINKDNGIVENYKGSVTILK